jgi:hypothetical protein
MPQCSDKGWRIVMDSRPRLGRASVWRVTCENEGKAPRTRRSKFVGDDKFTIRSKRTPRVSKKAAFQTRRSKISVSIVTDCAQCGHTTARGWNEVEGCPRCHYAGGILLAPSEEHRKAYVRVRRAFAAVDRAMQDVRAAFEDFTRVK